MTYLIQSSDWKFQFRAMKGGTTSLTITKLQNMEEGPYLLVTTRITPSFPFGKTMRLLLVVPVTFLCLSVSPVCLSISHFILTPPTQRTFMTAPVRLHTAGMNSDSKMITMLLSHALQWATFEQTNTGDDFTVLDRWPYLTVLSESKLSEWHAWHAWNRENKTSTQLHACFVK